MPYLTNDDIRIRLGDTTYIQLTDDANSGSPDESIVDEIRTGAKAEADSYLAARYATPVNVDLYPDTAALLKSFVIDIAEYRLHNRRPPVPVDVVRRHNEAIAWFTRVAARTAHLPDTPEISATEAEVVAAHFGPPRVFNRDETDDS